MAQIMINGIPNPDWQWIKLSDLLFAFYQEGYICSKEVDINGNKLILKAEYAKNDPNKPKEFTANLSIPYDNAGMYKTNELKVKIDIASRFWTSNETKNLRKLVIRFLESYQENRND